MCIAIEMADSAAPTTSQTTRIEKDASSCRNVGMGHFYKTPLADPDLAKAHALEICVQIGCTEDEATLIKEKHGFPESASLH